MAIIEINSRITYRSLMNKRKTCLAHTVLDLLDKLDLCGPFKCKARFNTSAEPQDCDWPTCGCDHYANKVIEALPRS